MEVIHLLYKIRSGNIPTKIKYDGQIWEYSEKGENYFVNDSTSINWDYVVFNCLNDEVEIIEENKKIGKISEEITTPKFIILEKMNEIIDKLNEMGDK